MEFIRDMSMTFHGFKLIDARSNTVIAAALNGHQTRFLLKAAAPHDSTEQIRYYSSQLC